MNELKDEINELTEKLRQTTNEQRNLQEEKSDRHIRFCFLFECCFFFQRKSFETIRIDECQTKNGKSQFESSSRTMCRIRKREKHNDHRNGSVTHRFQRSFSSARLRNQYGKKRKRFLRHF